MCLDGLTHACTEQVVERRGFLTHGEDEPGAVLRRPKLSACVREQIAIDEQQATIAHQAAHRATTGARAQVTALREGLGSWRGWHRTQERHAPVHRY